MKFSSPSNDNCVLQNQPKVRNYASSAFFGKYRKIPKKKPLGLYFSKAFFDVQFSAQLIGGVICDVND